MMIKLGIASVLIILSASLCSCKDINLGDDIMTNDNCYTIQDKDDKKTCYKKLQYQETNDHSYFGSVVVVDNN
jgi:hypothetical protein